MRSIWAVLLGVFFLISGCASGPDQKLIGIWTVDTTATEVPKMSIPTLDHQMQTALASVLLKLRADHTFTLVSIGPIEGTWKREGNEVVLKPTIAQHPIRMKFDEVSGRLQMEQKSPIGNAGLVLHKTG